MEVTEKPQNIHGTIYKYLVKDYNIIEADLTHYIQTHRNDIDQSPSTPNDHSSVSSRMARREQRMTKYMRIFCRQHF